MHINCSVCGAEVDKDTALVVEDEDKEIAYYCSPACLEAKEQEIPLEDPERDA